MTELLLMCTIAGRQAAIPAARVQSVIEIGEITPIPGTPPYILGLTALRSQALTVIDCTAAIGLEGMPPQPDSRAVVVEIEGHAYALVVEEAFDVSEARSQPTAVAGGFGRAWQQAALGMVETDNGPALLVDIAALIAGPLSNAA